VWRCFLVGRDVLMLRLLLRQVGLLYLVKGACIGLNGWIPVGGQVDPSSIVGDNLLRKNTQKNNTRGKLDNTVSSSISVIQTIDCQRKSNTAE